MRRVWAEKRAFSRFILSTSSFLSVLGRLGSTSDPPGPIEGGLEDLSPPPCSKQYQTVSYTQTKFTRSLDQLAWYQQVETHLITLQRVADGNHILEQHISYTHRQLCVTFVISAGLCGGWLPPLGAPPRRWRCGVRTAHLYSDRFARLFVRQWGYHLSPLPLSVCSRRQLLSVLPRCTLQRYKT